MGGGRGGVGGGRGGILLRRQAGQLGGIVLHLPLPGFPFQQPHPGGGGREGVGHKYLIYIDVQKGSSS